MRTHMLDVIEKLLTLQDRDQRLRAFENELASLPVEKQAREKQLADSAARLDQAKARVKVIEVDKRAIEVEITAKRGAIDRYRTQQLATRKNEEYTALSHEIEAAEKAIRDQEDKELELMDEAEKLAPQIAEAEKIHAEEKAKIDVLLKTLEGKKESIAARMAELKAERTKNTEGIDEDILDKYSRLFRSKHGAAVVPLEGEVCMGCHMKVTTQTVVAAKGQSDLVQCPQCGRILYYPA